MHYRKIAGQPCKQLHFSNYRKIHWEGSFEEYLDIVCDDTELMRNCRPVRRYTMILPHGADEACGHKEKVIGYQVFTEFVTSARCRNALSLAY